jgi:opacity protein-like surface antigen
MAPSFCRRLYFSITTGISLVMFTLLFVGFPDPALAEWYVAGFGGLNMPSSLSDTKMDAYGERLALQQFPGAAAIPPNGTLTQSFNTSDIGLKNSALFGGKAGYFFKDEGFSWLGVELEAFTSQPTIKSQTVSTTQYVTYLPFDPLSPGVCTPGINCQAQVTNNGTLPLSQSSMRLITVAFNVVARYPGEIFQPYAGVGVGAFYFNSSGQIDGRQVVPGLNTQAGLKVLVTEEWGLFVEGKYNYATINNLDPSGYGLSGTYNAFNMLAGIAYHF